MSAIYEYSKYKPCIFRLFEETFEHIGTRKRVRYMISCIRGSVVYYMKANESTVGYCLIEKGGGRYTFISKKDSVISPYIIKNEMRGKGIGTQLLKDIAEHREIIFSGNIYALVRKNNIASIHAMTKAEYELYGYANNVGVLRRYKLASKDDSKYLVFYRNINKK